MSCFFSKQKTAYEMRISDRSSDVCSSDLTELACLPLVEQTEGSGLTALTRGQFTSLGIETKYVFGSNSVAALGGLVAAGIGVACLPVKYFAPALRQKQMILLDKTPNEPIANNHVRFYHDDSQTLQSLVQTIPKASAHRWQKTETPK